MITQIIRKIIRAIMIRAGYSPFYAMQVWNERWDDLINNHSTSWRQKIWAQRRGFLSEKISIYGLTETNYRDYLSDFAYKKMYPINGSYSRWIDDKLVIRYLLEPFKEYLPKYYYQINKGQIFRLPDLPAGYPASLEGVNELAKIKGDLALKPITGSKGEGFYKLSYRNYRILINNLPASVEQLHQLVNNSKNYIITEYITAHEEIRKLYPDAPNTLRILVINQPPDDLILVHAYIRFGTRESGVVDNTSAGGIFAHVDLDTGRFSSCMRCLRYKFVSCPVHPDTGLIMEGSIPHMDLIKQKIHAICAHIPQLKYLGFDIIVTDDGFRIIEINSHPGIATQHHRPMFEIEGCRGFFNRHERKQRRG